MFAVFDRKPYILAILIAVLFAIWIVSGQFSESASAEEQVAASDDTERRPDLQQRVSVKTQRIEAQEVVRNLPLNGQTEPSRQIQIKVQTSGRIVEVLVERGALVNKGDVIAKIAIADRKLQIAQAKALVKQRELEYEGAKSLRNKGFNAQAKLAENFAQLEAARASLLNHELDLSYTTIRVPFNGILNERMIEVGDFVAMGQEVATLIDNDPLIVRGDVPEVDIVFIKEGMQGVAELPGREKAMPGTVRYIARQGDMETRTFKVELSIANPGQEIPAGISSTVHIPLERVKAHKVSPGLLSLNGDGVLGLKVLADTNTDTVQFKAIEIITSQADGLWVTGLQEREELIVLGQGFVRDGQQVKVNTRDD